MTTTYSIAEVHLHIREDGEHEEFDSINYNQTEEPWFEDEYVHISDAHETEDAYALSELFEDEEGYTFQYVIIYRYFDSY